jgi:hypothetical protein
MEHIDDYLAISQVCNEILSTIRYYPYPAIVYKIACNKYVDPETTTPTIETKINTTPSIKTEDINNPKDKDKKEDK